MTEILHVSIQRIQCLISLTFNVETPKALNTYIYISAHYIYASNDKPDEWSLKTNLLGTVRIEDYGRGENATTLAMRIVDQYGIRDKVSSFGSTTGLGHVSRRMCIIPLLQIEADVALGRKSTSPPSLWDQDSRMNVEGSAVSKNDCWPQAQVYDAGFISRSSVALFLQLALLPVTSRFTGFSYPAHRSRRPFALPSYYH